MAKINPGVYKAVLRVREAYAFDIAGFLMRFYVYMMNIGTITMLTMAGYSFFEAGVTSSAIALATFFIAPRVSKLIDERGQSRVVPLAAAVTLVGLSVMLAMVVLRGPLWALVLSAVLMGFAPSPQALVRARWTFLIRTGRLGSAAPDLRTMFSYEGVIDDITFMFSPAISIALATAIAPIAGMLAGGIAFVVGVVLLSASRGTEPQPGWSESVDAAAQGSDHGQGAETAAAAGDARGGAGAGSPAVHHRKSVLRTSPVVRVLFVFMMFVGAFYGVFDTATVALAEEIGRPSFASAVLVFSACVSMIMGFVFGMVNLRVPQHVQLVVCSVLIGCAYGTMVFIDSAVSLFAVATLAAMFYAPFLIVANGACERAVPGERLTEAITWMNAGNTCGLAFGPTIGGAIIDAWGSIASFDFGAVLALSVAVTGLVSFRLLKRNLSSRAFTELSKKPID